MPTRYQEVTSGSHGFETPDRTRLRDVRTGLQDLTGSEHQTEHAYNVSGWVCRISRVGNYISYMPTRHQDLTGSKHQNERAYEVTERRCMLSRARNTRSYMPTKYPDGAARSHAFGTPGRTFLEGIRKGLQEITGKEHQIVNSYEISGPGCRVSWVLTNRFNMPTRCQVGAAGSYG